VRTFIRLTDIHKQYGTQVILDGASVEIGEGDKIAVIGRNGAGKSTMCKLILAAEEADHGEIFLHDDLRLSYLEQQDPFLPDESVLAFLMRYSGGEDWRCSKLAGRFLLNQALLERPVSALSGGYQTRVKLCAMLLREPNFLILDEPTNYLDLRTLMLLERFLREFNGGFLIVSHDREFLMKTCVTTIEVERGRIVHHPGTVSAFLAHKQEAREQALRFNANLATKQRHLEDFVARNRARASSATQAQSKQKQLERLQGKEIDTELPQVSITIPPVEARKGPALRIEDLAVGYPERTVAEGIRFEIERGHHVAVVGDNGQGKTTFLRTIAGGLALKAGALKWGHAIRIGCYAQHVYGSLDEKQTVQGHLERQALDGQGTIPTQQVLDLAGCFLFRGDDVKKRIGVLSGGERSRLCLAGLLLGRHQMLILDEPTNHLDFETVEALAEALAAYNGTILFTSHDRTFVSRLATGVIEVQAGAVTMYPADYASYVYRIEQEVRESSIAERPAKGEAARDDEAKALRKTRRAELERWRGQTRKLEREIATLDTEKKDLERALAAAYDATQGNRLTTVTARLDAAEAEWLTASERMQELEAE